MHDGNEDAAYGVLSTNWTKGETDVDSEVRHWQSVRDGCTRLYPGDCVSVMGGDSRTTYVHIHLAALGTQVKFSGSSLADGADCAAVPGCPLSHCASSSSEVGGFPLLRRAASVRSGFFRTTYRSVFPLHH